MYVTLNLKVDRPVVIYDDLIDLIREDYNMAAMGLQLAKSKIYSWV
jgi:hypothetical protein